MEDLIIFRRQRATKGQWMSHELPRIKIEMPRGTFVVFKKVADLLKAGNRDAVMFAFNKKDKCDRRHPLDIVDYWREKKQSKK